MQVLDNDLLAFGDLEIRLKARTVHVRRAHVAVSPKEFELITYFARNAGQVVTRMQLLENVWNLHFDPGTNVVDVHVGRLRRKLEEAGQPGDPDRAGRGLHLCAPLPASA
jgi:two-component system OmpR family response regulator